MRVALQRCWAMTLPSDWSELRLRRFRDVPENCGERLSPGVRDLPEFHDWSDRETTPDQLRIERYLAGFDLRTKRLLHIGVGNSKLGKRFWREAREIVGTTNEANEVCSAQLRGMPNYKIVLQNKYAAETELTPGKFDFIIDNNPASYCCCMFHLMALFDFYKEKLAPGGQIVTDQEGLTWVAPAGNPLFGLDFDGLREVASTAGFSASKIDRNTYVVTNGNLSMRPVRIRIVLSQIRWMASLGARKSAAFACSLNRRYFRS